MSETKKISLVEIEVNKLSLQPGDVLLAKVSGPAFADEEVCEALKVSLKSVFPNNPVGVLFLEGNQIDLTVISQEQAQAIENATNPEKTLDKPVKVCDDCSCGKKIKVDNTSTEDFLKIANKVMEENKELFEDLAKLEELEKEQLKKEENGNESN